MKNFREIKIFLLGMFVMFLLMANWSDLKRGFIDGWNDGKSYHSKINK